MLTAHAAALISITRVDKYFTAEYFLRFALASMRVYHYSRPIAKCPFAIIIEAADLWRATDAVRFLYQLDADDATFSYMTLTLPTDTAST